MQSTSLKDLLLKKTKPEHQRNDLESLEFIRKNSPKLAVLDLIKINEFCDYVLDISPWKYYNSEFYTDTEVERCIHGKNHAIRVAINMLILVNEFGVPPHTNVLDLVYAGLLHDSSRVNDNKDGDHGDRSAKVLENLIDNINIFNLNGIKSGIKFHDVEYSSFEDKLDYKNNKHLVDLLKTADSLDRYRFPRTDWWINESHLKLIPTDTIKLFSFKIALESEFQFLKSDVNFENLLKNLKTNQIVCV